MSLHINKIRRYNSRQGELYLCHHLILMHPHHFFWRRGEKKNAIDLEDTVHLAGVWVFLTCVALIYIELQDETSKCIDSLRRENKPEMRCSNGDTSF